jgi:hypothetical protein
VEDALDKAVMGKILSTVKPSFLFAGRYASIWINGTPRDVLKSRLHAHKMEGGRNGTHASPAGVMHPVFPAPVTPLAMAPILQVQLDMILARLTAQYTEILVLKEVNVAQANAIAMI